ncbi:hypothetical protein Tco_0810619 [Tanacetum coccineum]
MTRVPFTIKILVITNLHSIIRASHNSLTVVSSVEVHILVLIVKQQQFDCCEDLDSESHFMRSHRDTNRILEELLRTLKPNSPAGEPDGSDDYTEVTLDEEQCLFDHYSAPVTPSPLAYTPSIPFLATMEPVDTFLMGDEVISTILAREIDEFIKSSVDDLVPIPRESEVTSDQHLDTLSTRDREIDFNLSKDIEELERLLVDDPVPVPRVFDAPLGNSDSISRSYDVTFSNPLFDFNDDYTLCYDNPFFNEEFEDISSLDPPKSTPVIDKVGGNVEGDGDPSFGIHHMPSPRLAYIPRLTEDARCVSLQKGRGNARSRNKTTGSCRLGCPMCQLFKGLRANIA